MFWWSQSHFATSPCIGDGERAGRIDRKRISPVNVLTQLSPPNLLGWTRLSGKYLLSAPGFIAHLLSVRSVSFLLRYLGAVSILSRRPQFTTIPQRPIHHWNKVIGEKPLKTQVCLGMLDTGNIFYYLRSSACFVLQAHGQSRSLS